VALSRDNADSHRLVEAITSWYREHARALPWRAPQADGWAVLVSEVMLQQTPVSRVLPAWTTWLQTWPTPAAMAAATPGEAVVAWGRLGYPRRALRLREAAVAVVERHGGVVPADLAELRALPGVGEYTAAAVASFAHRQRHVVLDTNVRRVLERIIGGCELPGASLTNAERARAEALLPTDPEAAATWNVAAMELGALVCTATNPRCPLCPVQADCAWLAAGKPAGDVVRKVQTYAGTDRQVRGRLLAALRDAAPDPVSATSLEDCWDEPIQRHRALDSLVADGLVDPLPDGRYALPGR
jgi:A/G-specific adenine glycosylase